MRPAFSNTIVLGLTKVCNDTRTAISRARTSLAMVASTSTSFICYVSVQKATTHAISVYVYPLVMLSAKREETAASNDGQIRTVAEIDIERQPRFSVFM